MAGTELSHADMASMEAQVSYAPQFPAVYESDDNAASTVHSQTLPFVPLALVRIHDRCPRDQIKGRPAKLPLEGNQEGGPVRVFVKGNDLYLLGRAEERSGS